MLRAFFVGFGVSLGLVAVACGGSVAVVEGGSSGSSGGASSSSSGGSSSGGTSGTGGTSGSSGGTCTIAGENGDRVCVPGVAQAGIPITLEADATQGCLACFATLLECKVTVTGSHIQLSMQSKVCPPLGDQACPAVCLPVREKCVVPPLAAGTYDVDLDGAPDHTAFTRQLVVADDASAPHPISCRLQNPDAQPPSQDAAKYATSCSTDDDCQAATFGTLCLPCSCPNGAIAKSAWPAYLADRREMSSQCPPDDNLADCAACMEAKPYCFTDGTSLTGTCMLKK